MRYKDVIFAIIGFFTFILGSSVYHLYIPVSKNSSSKVVRISKGMGARNIARLLKAEGLIRDELYFEFLAKIMAAERRLKAGAYSLNPSMNMIEIFNTIKSGSSYLFCFTIPEGYTINQIAQLLEEQGLIKEIERFITLAYDKEFISTLGLSDAVSLEGYLFPQTYQVHPGITEEQLLRIMVKECKKQVLSKREYQRAAKSLSLSMHQVITLASIIEKETSFKDEKSLISAVLHNRLKEGIPLCSDPTVIYALGDKFDGNLKKEDLKVDSKYNTYLYKGLPPGPIGSPSIDSIEAALSPAQVSYLYFVSMGNGKHKFSTTLNEHRNNVIEYQVFPYYRQR